MLAETVIPSRQDLPLVSIVTPSLNQGKYIRATIESVLQQNYPHLEYLVVDGGSTDETLAILREYKGRVRWLSEPDRGQSHAISKGFNLTRGSILAWLNSDDRLLPDSVSAAVAAFQANPAVALVYGDGRELDGEGRPVRDICVRDPHVWELIHTGDYILQPASFFRRDGFEAVGGLDEKLHWAMDYDLFIRLSLRFETLHLPRFLAETHVYDECKTMSGGWRRLREIIMVVRRYSTHLYPATCFNYAMELLETTVQQRSRQGRSSRVHDWITSSVKILRPCVENSLGPGTRPLYDDGWAGPVVDFHLRKEGGSMIRLCGQIPPEEQLFGCQRLRPTVNGVRLRDRILPPGAFEILIPLEGRSVAGFVHLRIEAARSFRNRKERDLRRLAFRVESIDLISSPHDLPEKRCIAGWYPDGWAAPRIHGFVQPTKGAIEISGKIPRGHRRLRGQRLSIAVNGELRRCEKVDAENFRFVVAGLPEPGLPVEVEISASRWFVPAQEAMTDDRRRLAFQLEAIRSLE